MPPRMQTGRSGPAAAVGPRFAFLREYALLCQCQHIDRFDRVSGTAPMNRSKQGGRPRSPAMPGGPEMAARSVLVTLAILTEASAPTTTTVTPGPPPALVVNPPAPPATIGAADHAVLMEIVNGNSGFVPVWDTADDPCMTPWDGVACDVLGNVKSLCVCTPPVSLLSLSLSLSPRAPRARLH